MGKLKDNTILMLSPLVLLYHRVANDPVDSQLLAVSPENFESHLKEVAENYRVLPLSNLLIELKQGELQPDTISLTFDDGYLDNLINALPLLEKHKIPATIFVTSGMVGSEQEFWWDALERIFLTGHPLPESLSVSYPGSEKSWDLTTAQGRLKAYDDLCSILRSDSFEDIAQSVKELYKWAGLELTARFSHRVVAISQLKELAKSSFIEIGSHSVTHTRLSVLSPEKQQFEIYESKKQLEAILKQNVRIFSYPFGTRNDFTQETERVVSEAGYEAGIANIQGNIASLSVNMYAIPRRLVRNWPAKVFANWLKEKDKDRLEAETILARNQKLIRCQLL